MLQFRLIPQSCLADRRCFLRVRNAAKYISQHLIKDVNAINSSIAVIGSECCHIDSIIVLLLFSIVEGNEHGRVRENDSTVQST